jgi:hypothetical protein
MTKKDYQLIAAAFQNARKKVFISTYEEPIMEAIQDELCRLLKEDNPAFKPEIFKYHCNLGRK